MTLGFTAGDAAYWGLAIFLVAVGLGFAYMLMRLGQAFERVSSFIRGAEREVLPVIQKTGGTVDRVNYQLDKLDTVTDSAVSMADSADTAVRAVSYAIAAPVEKISALVAGVSHGVATLRKTQSVGDAVQSAKDAAARRAADLREDLREAGRTPPSADRPEPTPPPSPTPKPGPVLKPVPTPKPPPAPAPPDTPAA